MQGQASADNVDPVLTDDPALPGAADPTRTFVVVPSPKLTAFLSGSLAVDGDGSGGASAGDTLHYSLVVSSVGGCSAAARASSSFRSASQARSSTT